ncbi:MAG: hypothetical protein JWN24_3759 [Phycisphaerales bacterium]|nr:hypothetical protein [Phycisphaerales bacterium]
MRVAVAHDGEVGHSIGQGDSVSIVYGLVRSIRDRFVLDCNS